MEKNILVLKEKGESNRYVRTINTIDTSFLTQEDGFLSNLININVIKDVQLQIIENKKNTISTKLNSIEKLFNSTIISDLYKKISLLKTEEDKKQLIEYIKLEVEKTRTLNVIGGHRRTKKINSNDSVIDMIEKEEDLFLSLLIKRVIIIYYTRLIQNNFSEELFDIEKAILDNDKKTDIILNLLYRGPKKNKEFKKYCKKVISDIVCDLALKERKHICFNCGLCCSCPKTNHLGAKIEDFKFIDSGFQLLDEAGKNLERFVVTDCKNYVSDIDYKVKTKTLTN